MSVETIKEKVVSALDGIGFPCSYLRYDGVAREYFIFHIIADWPTSHGNGKRLSNGYRVQLDGYGPYGLADVNDEAQRRLIDAGASYQGGRDFYESDTKLFRRMQEFYFYEEE